jgi:hypothetical protein
MLNTCKISNVFNEQEISNAFDAVARLTDIIEASAACDDDNAGGATVIQILQNLVINQEDSPEGRGNANAAREALDALQAAIRLLTNVMRGV